MDGASCSHHLIHIRLNAHRLPIAVFVYTISQYPSFTLSDTHGLLSIYLDDWWCDGMYVNCSIDI